MSINDTQDVLAIIEEDNKKSLTAMRLDDNGCKAHPRLVDGMERQMFLQTLTYRKLINIEGAVRMLGNGNGNGYAQMPKPKPPLKTGIFERGLKAGKLQIVGYSAAELVLIVIVLALAALVLNNNI